MKILPSIAASVLAASAFAAAVPEKSALPFVEDDYPRALSAARAKKLPIFADAWAPW
jgi:hypothetical protein